jgi:hypothetical protein
MTTIRERLMRRIEPQEQARIERQEPFRFMNVLCDTAGCGAKEEVTEENYDALAELVKDWTIGEHAGDRDGCPQHR